LCETKILESSAMGMNLQASPANGIHSGGGQMIYLEDG